MSVHLPESFPNSGHFPSLSIDFSLFWYPSIFQKDGTRTNADSKDNNAHNQRTFAAKI
jgi:hypothetical protein